MGGRTKYSMNIRDISELCGVSRCTTSRVLSGRAQEFRISEETARRVLDTARKAGYRPNYLAQSLNTGRTMNIGLVFANTIDLYLGGILEGAEEHLRDTEYQTVVATCENSLELQDRSLRSMLYRHVDGLIVYPQEVPLHHAYTLPEESAGTGKTTPLVVVGRSLGGARDEVMFDDHEAGCRTAAYFLAHGCRRFALLTRAINCSSTLARDRGFLETLYAAGVPRDHVSVLTGEGPAPEPAAVAQLQTVDAVFSITSGRLLHHLAALRTFRDLTTLHLASVGEIEGEELLGLRLRTLKPPTHRMGMEAARLLLRRIAQPDAPIERVVLNMS